ncbi:hypothetical protein AALA24_03115 [Anaerovoracaceae bacterium 42-11]
MTGIFALFGIISGIGRYDIQLTLKQQKKGLPGILIELKAAGLFTFAYSHKSGILQY